VTLSTRLATVAFAIVAAGTPRPLTAQTVTESVARFSLDSVVAVDEFGGENVSNRPQMIIDISAAMRIGDHWQVYVRPWFRLPRPSTPTATPPPWDTELYQAGVRYERPGRVATRVDAGYIISPIGLGLLDARPNLNPTIVPHLAYVVPMPSFDPTGPRVQTVAASYPLGAQVTASATHWDARVAVINSAPTRVYVLGAATNPLQTPVLVAGGGVTPITGLRLGLSFAHGAYATPDEISKPVPSGRLVTMAGGEGEWSFGYTKIRGEFIRSAFETSADTVVAREWFIQGVQTLTPRWFLAARQEGTSAPPLVTTVVPGPRLSFNMFEVTAGFRVTPEITLRSSYDTRESYGATNWDNQVGVSIVWAQRWW
jgi:hypothetical protein